MKPRMVVLLSLLFIVVSLVAIVGYYWVSQSAKVDASWIATIDEMLENAKTYLNSNDPGVLMSYCRIYLYEGGTKHLVYYGNPNSFGSYLTGLLKQVNAQKQAIISREYLDNVTASNKVVMINYRTTLIPTSQKFYAGYFILEDNLNEELTGTIIIQQDNGYSLWAITR
jgi:uncharacterized protein (UPF0333 family)